MSRTYKDQPQWVKARRTGRISEYHHYDCENDLENHGRWATRKCVDLKPAEWYLKETWTKDYIMVPDRPWGRFVDRVTRQWVFEEREVVTYKSYFIPPNLPCDLDLENPASNIRGANRCKFYYDYSTDGGYYSYFYGNPGKERKRKYYYKPERRHTNDTLNEAVKDYNTNGDTDIEPIENRNPSGPWLAGYWD